MVCKGKVIWDSTRVLSAFLFCWSCTFFFFLPSLANSPGRPRGSVLATSCLYVALLFLLWAVVEFLELTKDVPSSLKKGILLLPQRLSHMSFRGSPVTKSQTHLKPLIEWNSFSSSAHGLTASVYGFWVLSTSPQSLLFWHLLRLISLIVPKGRESFLKSFLHLLSKQACCAAQIGRTKGTCSVGGFLVSVTPPPPPVSRLTYGLGGCPWKYPSIAHCQLNVGLACLGLGPRRAQMPG